MVIIRISSAAACVYEKITSIFNQKDTYSSGRKVYENSGDENKSENNLL